MRSKTGLVTLLTDFGTQDEYVGVVKGVIATVNPNLQVIDLTHQIPPQDIEQARFCLMNAYPYFPEDTVHIAVVDPGVGSQRRAIAVQLESGFLVAPDNGLLSGVIGQNKVVGAVELTNSDYWHLKRPSNTFHARDIFAPVGAHLASGVNLKQLGKQIDLTSLVELDLPQYIVTDTAIQGCIQYIDRFGNLISNIPQKCLEEKNILVKVKELKLKVSNTYNDVNIGEVVALVGSHGWIEIAVNSGNAALNLNMKLGSTLELIEVNEPDR
ncbi:MAG: S-adenosyl-l-methionine hydroxide adenosyltransferase family protein [Mastigocoleus sp.]